MFIVTIDTDTRGVTDYYVPRSPLNIADHAGDATKLFIGREQFASVPHLLHFRRYHKKYRVTADGVLERYLP